MKKNNRKIILALIGICFMGLIGFTIAYFRSQMVKDNIFKTLKQDVHLEENFNPDTWPEVTTKEVTIKNDNLTSPVIVRMSINERWFKEIGDNTYVLNNLYDGEEVVTKKFINTFQTDWTYKDGWYYYNHLLNPSSEVKILESIMLNDDLIKTSPNYNDYLSYNYELSFNYEASQATEEAVKELWGVDVSIQGNDVTWN